MKKKLIVLVIFLFAGLIYVIFYHKNKNLKYVPKNTDALILVDVKNLTRQYLYDFITHPSLWFEKNDTNKNTISLKESGVKIPDFLQIFHIKNTRFSSWYTILELKDNQKFSAFLKSRKFIDKGNNFFQKEHFFVKIEGENCILGTSALDFKNSKQQIFSDTEKNNFNANSFITNSLGSISFISGQRTRNFSIAVYSDEIEIKSVSDLQDFSSVISKLQQTKSFLEAELDHENIKNFTSFFDKMITDSSQITHFKSTVNLEQVNDTIITYGYDDNFNEVEKKSIQKIIQPNYVIDLQSSNQEKTEQYFQNKKWINAQKQFTAIPFQPNTIEKNETGFEIKSTRKPIQLSSKLNENYIFVRNNALLLSSFKSLTKTEKKLISDIDYIFYGNNEQDYYLKLKFKKGYLPLLLRW
jgi:hypothetical protein